jgi:hypothetical protein
MTVKSVVSGSIMITMQFSVPSTNDATTLLNTIQSNLASSTSILGYNVLSTSAIPTGFSPSITSTTTPVNLPLIIGLAVPFSILFIVIIVIVVIKVRGQSNEVR